MFSLVVMHDPPTGVYFTISLIFFFIFKRKKKKIRNFCLVSSKMGGNKIRKFFSLFILIACVISW